MELLGNHVDQAENQPAEYYITEKLADKLFKNSFFLSQGSPSLQYRIFSLLSVNNPTFRISDEVVDKISISASTMAASMATKGMHDKRANLVVDASFSRVISESKSYAEAMQKIFSGEVKIKEYVVPPTVDQLLGETLIGIISRDYKFTCNVLPAPAGRVRKKEQSSHQSMYSDPFLSHFCHFILNKASMGDPYTDEVLKNLRAFLDTIPNEAELRKIITLGDYLLINKVGNIMEIVDLIVVYNRKHPETPAVFPLLNDLVQRQTRIFNQMVEEGHIRKELL